MKGILLALVRLYQLTLSRTLPPTCRFEPSCSQYTYQAIERFGALRGGWMGVKRLVRCNPFNPGGYDPVPELEEERVEPNRQIPMAHAARPGRAAGHRR